MPDLDRLPADAALWRGADPPGPEICRLVVALRQAIGTLLTARQREAVELHYFEGLSQGQIARRLGVSQQVINKRLHGDRRQGRRVGGALPRLRAALEPLLERPGTRPANEPVPTTTHHGHP